MRRQHDLRSLSEVGCERHDFLVPYQRNAYFTGREDLLSDLELKLFEELPGTWCHRVAIYGLGGVGKTQLALEYTYSRKERYNSIYWISAATQASLLSGFQEIARTTQCVRLESNLKPTEIAERVTTWLGHFGDWLLILDNLDDVTVLDGYLPKSSASQHILITTRNQHYDQIPSEGVPVGLLSAEEAVNLLLNRSKVAHTADSKAEAAKIVEELGYLALAIEQAAAYIREASKDIFKFLTSYRLNRTKYHARISQGNRSYYAESLATAWRLSFQRLEVINVDASNMLRLLAFLNPDGVSVEFLERGGNGLESELKGIIGSPERLFEALCVLERFSFIGRQHIDAQGQRITMHRLVQHVIKDEMPHELRGDMMREVVCLCNSAFPPWHDWDPKLLELSRSYETQVVGPLLEVENMPSTSLGDVLSRVGLYLREDGKSQQANVIFIKTIDVFTLAKGREDSDTLSAVALLAWGYQTQGLYQKAAELEEQVLEARKRLLGTDHPETLEAMVNLASTYRSQGRYQGSAKLTEVVVEVRTRLLGPNHPDTLLAMGILGNTYRSQGAWDKSCKLEEMVLAARLISPGREHPCTLVAMGNLAITYRNLGYLEKAFELESEGLEAGIKLFGEEHPETLMAMNNIGCTLREQGRLSDSINILEKTVEIRTRRTGVEHPDTVWAKYNLATAYLKQGESATSVILLEDAQSAMVKALGGEHPMTLSIQHSLALNYWDLDRAEDARELLKKVVDKRKRSLGDQHPHTLESTREFVLRFEKMDNSKPCVPPC